jgi:hypothetical protein
MGEVGTPPTPGMEDEFRLKCWAVCRSPEEREPGFQAGRGSLVAEPETGHPRAGESTDGQAFFTKHAFRPMAIPSILHEIA